MPPHMRKPILLMLEQTIGFSIPSSSSTSSSAGMFIVMNPGSALYRLLTWSAKMRNASLKPRPSSRSTTTFWRKITGVLRPWNIFISASISSVVMPSMSFLASDVPPRIAASIRPSSGRNRLTAPSMPSSVTALAYLWAYGMHG